MQFDQPSAMHWVPLCTAVFVQCVAALRFTMDVGSELFLGDEFEITWENAVGRVNIGLLRDGDDRDNHMIAMSYEGDGGSFMWDIVRSIEPGDGYVLALDDEHEEYRHIRSDEFTIIDPRNPDGTTSGDETDLTTTTTGGSTVVVIRTVSFPDGVLITTASEAPSTTSTSDATSATSSNTAGGSSESGDSDGGDDSSGGGGASNASTIGIAVGVTLGVLGLLGLAAGYWLYRRPVRNRNAKAGDGGADRAPSSELRGAGAGAENKGVEIGGNPVSEMPAPNVVHELAGDGGTQRPVELSAGEPVGGR